MVIGTLPLHRGYVWIAQGIYYGDLRYTNSGDLIGILRV